MLMLVDINEYLITQTRQNWPDLLSNWREALPENFTLWMVNRCGDLFSVREDGSVHMLDVGAGQLKRLADSRENSCSLIDVGDNANIWLMIALVDDCVASGVIAGSNQCYGYRVPPTLGGEYHVSNIEPTDLSVHYSFLADVWRQTRDLPDGTRIRAVIAD
jgi:hypothetical protein